MCRRSPNRDTDRPDRLVRRHRSRGDAGPVTGEIAKWFNAVMAQEETQKFLFGAGQRSLDRLATGCAGYLLAAFDKYRQAVRAAKIEPQ